MHVIVSEEMSSKPVTRGAHGPSTSQDGLRKKKKNKRSSRDKLKHPYILKFESHEFKILTSLNKMFELADNDLVICDRRTGLNNYSINLKFADKLDNLAKSLVTMSNKCYQQAMAIHNKISESQDKKRDANEDLFFLGEVMKEGDKCDLVQSRKSLRSSHFKTDPDCLPLPPPPKTKCTITISTDEDDKVFPGDADTKFMFPRENTIHKEWYQCQD